jgi:hypothetical protein
MSRLFRLAALAAPILVALLAAACHSGRPGGY